MAVGYPAVIVTIVLKREKAEEGDPGDGAVWVKAPEE